MKHGIGDLLNENKKACCICGKQIKGYGNNPWPIADNGRCCDECNYDVVLPARISGLKEKKTEKTSVPDAKVPPKYTKSDDLKNMLDNLEWSVNFTLDQISEYQRSRVEDDEITLDQYNSRMEQEEKRIKTELHKAFEEILNFHK